MSDTPFKDHFSSAAVGYAAHRPTYPATLADHLAALAPARDLALDCGCGNGQLSVLLAERFGRVVGTDASAGQIARATPRPNLAYRVAPAQESGLPPASVDLVTVAHAAHWFDLDAFYAEARRIGRPGAVLALIAYGVLRLEGGPGEVVADFYGRVLGRHWPPERVHVERGYRDLPFPFAEIGPPALSIEVDWSLADLVGYVDTWSALRSLERAEGRGAFERFRRALGEAWGAPESRRQIVFPLALRLGRIGEPAP